MYAQYQIRSFSDKYGSDSPSNVCKSLIYIQKTRFFMYGLVSDSHMYSN